MCDHTGFDPYLIGERNRQIFEEVRALRLEERLRKSRKGHGSRPGAFSHYLKGTLHLLRRTGLAGR
jgi:hypothetical protein